MIKNLYMSLIYFFASILIGTIFITIFNYFNILNNNIITSLKLIIPLLSLFISSYILGTKSNKRGYIEGLKLGSIIIIIFLVVTLITKSFTIRTLLYYSILLLTSTLGSMIGINKKKK